MKIEKIFDRDTTFLAVFIAAGIALKLAAQTPTPTPTPTGSPTPTPPPAYQVVIAWTPLPPTKNVQHYTLYWSVNPPDSVTGKFNPPFSSSAVSANAAYRSITLPIGTYFFAVTATNAQGESDYSNIGWKHVVPIVGAPPPRPDNLNVLTP